MSIHNPLNSVHIFKDYCCTWPHSGQNLLARGIGLPQLMQNLVSALGVVAALVAALSPDAPFLMASIMAWPMATPAPSPAPTPAPPPPSFPAAIGMDWAT